MKSGATVAVILIYFPLAGCATTTIRFAENGSDCKRVAYHPLCDADVHAAFPELKLSDGVLDVDSFDRISSDSEDVHIWYTPEVTGPHTVRTKEVVCQQANDRQQFWCRIFRNDAYFYSNPDYYLTKKKDVSMEDAVSVVRLLETGKVISEHPIWPGITSPRNIYSFSLKAWHAGLALFMIASGCSGAVDVGVEGSGQDQMLRIINNEITCY